MNDAEQYLLCIVNAQDELPVIPLHHLMLKLHLPCMPRQIRRVATGQELAFSQCGDHTTVLYLACVTEAEFLLVTP